MGGEGGWLGLVAPIVSGGGCTKPMDETVSAHERRSIFVIPIAQRVSAMLL